MLPACMNASQRKALPKLHETANTVERDDFWPLDGISAYFSRTGIGIGWMKDTASHCSLEDRVTDVSSAMVRKFLRPVCWG
jgi:hypothetical protein